MKHALKIALFLTSPLWGPPLAIWGLLREEVPEVWLAVSQWVDRRG